MMKRKPLPRPELRSLILVVTLSAAVFMGYATRLAPRRVYKESQFNSRLEYLRFFQRYELQTGAASESR
jgi:hypothetical protein